MARVSDGAIGRLRAAAAWPDLTGTRYDLLDCIGEGGMGAVFRARDRELGRDVAIKVAAFGFAPDADRLRHEARVLATLEHAGIVPVHDVGVLPDGRAFYVMALVRGTRLDAHLAGVRDLDARLRLFDRVCDTVAFAHAHGVIHRDLKPANIMVGSFGEVRVVDWGLARVGGRVADAVAGTDGYMAPEQRQGQADARSDVYALGAILRDLSASCDEGGRRRRTLRAIVARAMADDPRDRYQDAAALADDVRRFSSGAAVDAYRESPIERAGRLVVAYRTPIALILAYLAMRVVLLLWGRL